MKQLPAAVVALSASLTAQVPPLEQPRGAFHSIPHFLSTSDGPSALPELAWKPQGDIAPYSPIAAIPVVGAPDFRLISIFGANVAARVRIDAIATGNDHIPGPGTKTIGGVTYEGCLDPDPTGATGWVAITFTVRAGVNSDYPGTVIGARRAVYGDSHISGDLYGYFLPGSDITPLPPSQTIASVPAMLVDRIYLEQGREHMGVPAGRDMDAHDAYLPFVQAGVPVGQLLTRTDRLFFSLTPASAADIALNVPNWLPNGRLAHPADVYMMTWNNQTSNWTGPTLFRTWEELWLAPGSNVDALAVYTPNQPTREALIFSTENEPLLIQGSDKGRRPVPPRDRGGRIVTIITTGDVDGISVFDPEIFTANASLAFPINDNVFKAPDLTMCATLEDLGNRHLLSVSGFRPGQTGRVITYLGRGASVTPIDSFIVNGSVPTIQRTVRIAASVPVTDIDLWAQFFSSDGTMKYTHKVRMRR